MSGAFAVTSSRTACGTARWTSTRSATATSWCASTLPASDASAPFGNRIAKDGVCSNESGIEKSRTFMNGLETSCRGRSLLYACARGGDSDVSMKDSVSDKEVSFVMLCPPVRHQVYVILPSAIIRHSITTNHQTLEFLRPIYVR